MEHDPELEDRLRAAGTRPIDPTCSPPTSRRWRAQCGRRGGGPRCASPASSSPGSWSGAPASPRPGRSPTLRSTSPTERSTRVGVEVPDPQRYHGPECGAEVKKNHGAYVQDDHDLAKSDCGKKVKGGRGRAGGQGARARVRRGAGKDGASMTPSRRRHAAERPVWPRGRGRREDEEGRATGADDDDNRTHDHHHDQSTTDHRVDDHYRVPTTTRPDGDRRRRRRTRWQRREGPGLC